MTDPDLEVTRIRRFGTIVARKRSDGSISAWLARYSSPVDGRRVQRSFESVRDAESWLAGEHELVEMHRRGLKQWVHPTDRDRRKKAGSMTFDELADWYVDTHRKPDGTALRGAARRNLRTDVGHLKDVFGGMTVKQITPDVISKWYFGEHEEGEWVFPRMCQRLKAIMDVLADHLGDIGMEDGWDDPHVAADGSIKCGCLAEFPDITAWRAPRPSHHRSPLPYFLLTNPAGPEAEYQLNQNGSVDISLFVCIIRNNQWRLRISTGT